MQKCLSVVRWLESAADDAEGRGACGGEGASKGYADPDTEQWRSSLHVNLGFVSVWSVIVFYEMFVLAGARL